MAQFNDWIKYSVVGQVCIGLNAFAITLMLIFCIVLFSCNNSTGFDKRISVLLENNGLAISKAVHVAKSSNSSAVTYTFIFNKDDVISLVNKLGLKPYDNPSNKFLQDNSKADPAWWRIEGPFDSGILKDTEIKSILMMYGASESYLEITFTPVINDN